MFAEKTLFAESTSKSSNVHVKLEESITRLFAEAQEESEKRKAACSQYLTKMLAEMEVLVQRDIEPETSEIIAMIGKRSKLGTKLVDEHLGSIETIENELEAAVQQANGHVNAHKDHRKQSRKAAMKEAQHEFKRGVDMQKLALDANAYIRHYRKLIML
ncbi:hypothetical protein CPB86DRAFT_565843 [Serendipita vermifera]|nr:hypothetical protein CPB86DRAFT_565843 [Serendipita vermifera]